MKNMLTCVQKKKKNDFYFINKHYIPNKLEILHSSGLFGV